MQWDISRHPWECWAPMCKAHLNLRTIYALVKLNFVIKNINGNYIYFCVSAICVWGVCAGVQVPAEARRGHQSPWSWEVVSYVPGGAGYQTLVLWKCSKYS